MQGISYLLLPVILLLGQAATAAEPAFGTDAENKYTRELRPAQGKAIVYIYQRQQDGSGVSPVISLNNREIGRLLPGTFTVWQFSPGQVNVRVNADVPASQTIAVEAGKVYLFRLVVTQAQSRSVARLTALPESYRGDLAATRLIKNPQEMTAAQAALPAAAPATPVIADKPVVTDTPRVEDKPAERPVRRTQVSLQPGGVGLLLKTGALTLSEDRQTILGDARVFDDSTSGLYGVEALYQFPSGVSVGGEILGFTANFVTEGSSDRHDVDVLIVFANARQYFRTDASLQPYIGAGIGVAVTDTSGPTIVGSTSGLAYQLLAGAEYRSGNFGLFAEYKYLSADTESSNNEKIDVSGSGLFAGVAFHF